MHYMSMCMCIYIYIYTYTYIERERYTIIIIHINKTVPSRPWVVLTSRWHRFVRAQQQYTVQLCIIVVCLLCVYTVHMMYI